HRMHFPGVISSGANVPILGEHKVGWLEHHWFQPLVTYRLHLFLLTAAPRPAEHLEERHRLGAVPPGLHLVASPWGPLLPCLPAYSGLADRQALQPGCLAGSNTSVPGEGSGAALSGAVVVHFLRRDHPLFHAAGEQHSVRPARSACRGELRAGTFDVLFDGSALKITQP